MTKDNNGAKRPLWPAAVLAAFLLSAAGGALALGLPHIALPHIGRSSPAASTSAASKPPPAEAARAQAAANAAAPTIGFKSDAPPHAFAQEVSDLKADPSVRFGVLPNGMRYAIRHNATPPGQASLRLRIDAGSLMEADDQQGLAHFLEHMAFKGSKEIPAGDDMVKILERLGLAFGADTNASTSYDETVYKLDLPKSDQETVDTALGLLRGVGGDLTLAQSAMDSERGVVLSEERLRDTPSYHVFEQQLAFMMKDQRPPLRSPIGKVDVIKNAARQRLADFYHAYYRPQRALLVVVGDFDVDAMEAKIKTVFGDWKNPAPDGAAGAVGPVAKRGEEAKVVVQPGAQESVELVWMNPPDKSLDTTAKERRLMVRNLGLAVLNRRLSARIRAADPPFVYAAGSRYDMLHGADIAALTATSRPGEWRKALEALDLEQRRLTQYGVRQDELDREITEYRSSLTSAVAGAETRRTPGVAAEIAGTIADDGVVTSPQQDLALFETIVKGLKADEVSAAIKEVFTGQGPLLFVATPNAIAGAEKTVLDAYHAAQKVAVTPPAASTASVWPYGVFGPVGKVAERTEVADLDTVFVRFENGVRLTVKPTKFRTDQIYVSARFGYGLSALPSDKVSLSWAGSAFVEGGLKQLTTEDMERVLASKTYGADFAVDETAFALSGGTRPQDLETQMQVLAAYFTEPGWRPEGFDRLRNYMPTMLQQMGATDSGVLRRDLAGLLHNGDKRWALPDAQQAAAAKLDDLKAMVQPALSGGPIEIVVVGDTTVEKAIDAVATTFGSLPARPAPKLVSPPPGAVRFPAPTPTPVDRTHGGRADQAIAYLAWPIDDFYADPRRARASAVLGDVLKLRLIDELRIRQGATYSPSVGYSASQVWPGYGYLAASEEAPPALMDGFFRDVSKIAADLRDHPIGADELERAKSRRLEAIQKSQQTNEYWLTQLSGAQADPRLLDAVRSSLAGYEAVGAADIQAAAARFLKDDKAFKLVIKPKAAS